MLFNSQVFIFLFLPVALAGFFVLARRSHLLAAGWLAIASLVFYAYWNPKYVLLLLGSVCFNHLAGSWLIRLRTASAAADAAVSRKGLVVLVLAVCANLALLGYYKYANFFVESANQLAGTDWQFTSIVLPLGISFFTFTQIAFLVDARRGAAKEYHFAHYLLFVTYFPHLIAGPILQHRQMMPQFADPKVYRLDPTNLAVGFSVFSLGLAKKVLLADNLAVYADPVFGAASHGVVLTFWEAWAGALAYSLQLYFDFSAYSDMAIGLSRLFGIQIPLNFDSPYKATSFIDFWRRWHMSLSAFLRDYLYIPLGGNRLGEARRYANILATMLLGGLWHGAGWGFVLWGGLHGVLLALNHGWRRLAGHQPERDAKPSRLRQGARVVFVFVLVVFAWVFFRSESLHGALNMLSSMLFQSGVRLPKEFESHLGFLAYAGFEFGGGMFANGLRTDWNLGVAWILLGLSTCWLLPNSQKLVVEPSSDGTRSASLISIRWQPTVRWAAVTGGLFVVSVLYHTRVREFLYWQF